MTTGDGSGTTPTGLHPGDYALLTPPERRLALRAARRAYVRRPDDVETPRAMGYMAVAGAWMGAAVALGATSFVWQLALASDTGIIPVRVLQAAAAVAFVVALFRWRQFGREAMAYRNRMRP
jgi:hypothetical protein